MPTLKDVAELAGVSVATVSHVINNTRNITPQTRARVESAIARLDYVPNTAGRLLALQRAGGGAVRPDGGAAGDEPRRPPREKEDSAQHASHAGTHAHGGAGHARTARMLLRLVRAAQPLSRVELASRLGLSRSTITEIVKPLVAAGLVREEEERKVSGLGRPRVALTLEGEHSLFAGVNLGVRRSQVGLSNSGGEILAEEEFDTPAEAASALALARAGVERLRANFRGRALKLVGVSASGPTSAGRDRLLYAPRLGWRDVAVADALRFTSGPGGAGDAVPVVVENDATAAAMYEARLRLRDVKGGELSNFVLVRSGTGIGVGLVMGGEVYRGTGAGEGLAGEFGHMIIVAGGKPCVCGNRGCWERYASASAASTLYMGDRVQLGAASAPRYVEIVSRAEAGEIRAQRTLARVGEYLGIGIGNVITGLGVPRVIVSGRVVYGWRFISEPLFEAVGQSLAGKLSGWSVEPGEPRGAGLGGALEVAADEYLTACASKVWK
jgi:predicted NBD/HSP70 family sugar kinase/plasmid maintenance system antidote protein VapI